MLNKMLFLLVLVTGIYAQDTADRDFFVQRQIKQAKRIALETKDVVVIVETEAKALLIFCNGKFSSVLVHSRKRNVGMNISGMDFVLLDKVQGKQVVFKRPRRFRSFFANANDIKIRKGTFNSFTNKVTSTSEFFRVFVLNNRRRATSSRDFIDVQIVDFREKKDKKTKKK